MLARARAPADGGALARASNVGGCSRPPDPDGALLRRINREGREKAAAKGDKAAARQEREEQEAAFRGSAVVYVGSIPAGFYEEAQFQFFSQYGKVTRLRLSRDKATSKYRGYGFVEFADAKVAHQVCKEMDGYIMYGKRLRVHLVRPEQLHPQLFRNCHRAFVKVNWRKVAEKRVQRRERAKAADPRKEMEYLGKLIKKEQARLKRIKGAKLAGQTLLGLGWELDTDMLTVYRERIDKLKIQLLMRAKKKAGKADKSGRAQGAHGQDASISTSASATARPLTKGVRKKAVSKGRKKRQVAIAPEVALASKVARESGHLA